MTEEKNKRGFATYTPERVREIARLGGLAAQAKGNAHRFTPEEARLAGAKGGRVCHERLRARKAAAAQAKVA